VGQQEIHEYEASGGCLRRPFHCRITSFFKDCKSKVRKTLDATKIGRSILKTKLII
jgi:hypothetical protein